MKRYTQDQFVSELIKLADDIEKEDELKEVHFEIVYTREEYNLYGIEIRAVKKNVPYHLIIYSNKFGYFGRFPQKMIDNVANSMRHSLVNFC